MADFDVLFLGSGQGAWNGAIPMVNQGLRVGVIEAGEFGGVCTNRGCNAKITLDRPIELARAVQQMQGMGLDSVPKVNWRDLMAHKHAVIDGLAAGNEDKLKAAGVQTIHGFGKFVSAHELQVGERTYTADRVVIVTGQLPHQLDIPGADYLHDSTDFLNLPELPKRLTVIGGGYVGMEIASIANGAGADVDVILRGQRPLRDFYSKYVDRLVTSLRERGVKFHLSETIEAVEKNGDELLIKGAHGFALPTDYVVNATGREPVLTGFGLEKIGVNITPHGIPVNDHLETNVAGVYATGDVVDKKQPKITPTAIFESQYLAALFTKQTTAPIDYPAIAQTVFTLPRVAQVGVTVATAQANPDQYSIQEYDYANDWFRQVGNLNDGALTLVFDQHDQVVGATEVSDTAVETINGLLDMIELHVSHTQAERLIYIFPSYQHSYFRKV